ncbi:MAG: hypothetical protein H7343_11395 [Undibacterium sp.]|nr:hypothetical protein [Opitutaceae bacterium]
MAHRDFSVRLLQRVAPLGAVSFAFYVVAGPLQLGQRALFPDFSGSGLAFIVRLVGAVAAVALTVWLLERHICPPLTAALRR